MQKRSGIVRKFDYSFLDNGLLPANLVNLTGGIYSLRTAAGVRKEDNLKIFTELEAIAKVQSVKSSNAIEGIITSDQRIAAIVNHSSAPLNHDEAEIAGYRDALNAVHVADRDACGGEERRDGGGILRIGIFLRENSVFDAVISSSGC